MLILQQYHYEYVSLDDILNYCKINSDIFFRFGFFLKKQNRAERTTRPQKSVLMSARANSWHIMGQVGSTGQAHRVQFSLPSGPLPFLLLKSKINPFTPK